MGVITATFGGVVRDVLGDRVHIRQRRLLGHHITLLVPEGIRSALGVGRLETGGQVRDLRQFGVQMFERGLERCAVTPVAGVLQIPFVSGPAVSAVAATPFGGTSRPVSGLPAFLPGLSLLAVGLTGTLAEVAYLLKTEVEMCLALAHVHGFDIRGRRERQLAFLLASVGTQEAAGRSVVSDLVRAEEQAIWSYGPRVVSRLILEGFAVLALGSFWRGALKAVPVLGVAVGSGLNRALTSRVGKRALAQLQARRAARQAAPALRPRPRRAARRPATARRAP